MKLIIIGIGEVADIAFGYFTHDSDYEVCGFSINAKHITTNSYNGKPLVALEDIEKTYSPSDYMVFVALVENDRLNISREELYKFVKSKGYKYNG